MIALDIFLLLLGMATIAAIVFGFSWVAGLKAQAQPTREMEHLVRIIERMLTVDDVNAFIPANLRKEAEEKVNHYREEK